MESISEEDLNLLYVLEDTKLPEATDNLENSPYQEDEYDNRIRNRTLDLSMFKQLPEFKKYSDPEIFKDNFMRCVVLFGLQVSDPRTTIGYF
uniref:DDE_Tnp_1_7 domain-containing protein n=1 Tax=Strongyloides stercoralis TaxID=6248 RepID=A0A0K0EC38_STRER